MGFVGAGVVGDSVGCWVGGGGSVGSTVGVLVLNSATLVGWKVGNRVGDTVGSLQMHFEDELQVAVFVPSTFIIRMSSPDIQSSSR